LDDGWLVVSCTQMGAASVPAFGNKMAAEAAMEFRVLVILEKSGSGHEMKETE